MPVQRSHPQPCVQVKKARKQVTTGTSNDPTFPARLVLTVYPRALPGVPGLLATVASRVMSCEKLDPSVGGPGPRALTVRNVSPLVVRRRSRPSHPASTFVTTRTPLLRVGMTGENHIFLKNGSDLFFVAPLERADHIGAAREISFLARCHHHVYCAADERRVAQR
jgi:hypothetical protein